MKKWSKNARGIINLSSELLHNKLLCHKAIKCNNSSVKKLKVVLGNLRKKTQVLNDWCRLEKI